MAVKRNVVLFKCYACDSKDFTLDNSSITHCKKCGRMVTTSFYNKVFKDVVKPVSFMSKGTDYEILGENPKDNLLIMMQYINNSDTFTNKDHMCNLSRSLIFNNNVIIDDKNILNNFKETLTMFDIKHKVISNMIVVSI